MLSPFAIEDDDNDDGSGRNSRGPNTPNSGSGIDSKNLKKSGSRAIPNSGKNINSAVHDIGHGGAETGGGLSNEDN